MMQRKIFIEINVNQDCTDKSIESRVLKWLRQTKLVRLGQTFHQSSFQDYNLRENVVSVRIEGLNCVKNEIVNFENPKFSPTWLVYKLNTDESYDASLEQENDEANVVTGKRWRLPHIDFDGYWSSLVFDSDLKDEVLNYSNAILEFAMTDVDPSIISSNKVILFHGPPGTGKTTLCKAMAQKLAIRLGKYYLNFEMMEINSHSLFSKWFSESGKLVMKMFDAIKELVKDTSTLVFVLIDEIESLAKARNTSIATSECSDAIRVVNAILTQIDSIKSHPNVLILTTSNLTSAIDEAFMDRVDFMRHVGLPTTDVIYKILLSCVNELQLKNVIKPGFISPELPTNDSCSVSFKLLNIAQMASMNVSGRSLRKMPLLAYAALGCPPVGTVSLCDFLGAMEKVIWSKKALNRFEENGKGSRSDENVIVTDGNELECLFDD